MTDDSSYMSVDLKSCVKSCTANIGTEFRTYFDTGLNIYTKCIYPT